MNGVARRDSGRVAQDPRLVRVPRDRVAAAEDGERAERVEPAGRVLELCAGAIAAAGRGASHPAVNGDKPGANLGQPPPGVEHRQLALELLQAALSRREARTDE